MLNLNGNRKVGKTIIAGTFFVVGVKNGVIASLTKENQDKYYKGFEKIEIYSDSEVASYRGERYIKLNIGCSDQSF